jgi:alpha-tubulin suppressor-like RCC1 family protein
MKNFKFSSLLHVPMVALLAVLAACGGGGGGDAAPATSTPTPTTPTLRSIAVTIPGNATTIAVGTPAKVLVATGSYSDGTTKPLTATNGLIWSASSPTVVNVATNGSLTPKAVGTATVSATLDTVVGTLPITVTAPWVGIIAGGYQTVARKADGNLYSWGSNVKSQLGDNSTIDRNAPVQVAGTITATTTWKQVAVGEQYVVAIRTDGTLWAWGYNQDGQLGDGTQINRVVPTQIGSAKDWATVAAGRAHTLALKVNGNLYAWGRNDKGQLGDPLLTGANRLAPSKIGILLWSAIAAGDTHSLAIQRDTNDLYGWGGNAFGQVGNASKTDVTAPVKIGTQKYSSVSAGISHSAAISTSGTLYAWGLNSSGQLGNNATVDITAPVLIGTDNNWSQVAGGGLHTIGLRNDGTLWSWGANDQGQLGTGASDTLVPQQIGTGSNWKAISSGIAHSFGLQTDDTLWGWGRNLEGQLGNGKNALYSAVPVNVPN